MDVYPLSSSLMPCLHMSAPVCCCSGVVQHAETVWQERAQHESGEEGDWQRVQHGLVPRQHPGGWRLCPGSRALRQRRWQKVPVEELRGHRHRYDKTERSSLVIGLHWTTGFLVGAFLVKSARLLQWLVFFFFFRQTTISLWLGHFSYKRNY